jgi:hypothetical protein
MSGYFFVTGMGRSGTKWLADLLNRSPTVACHHEPFSGFDNERTCHLPWADGHATMEYLRARKSCIDEKRDGERWGEVNSYLRLGIVHIRRVFGDCPIAGLIRDGRESVKSLMTRNIFKNDRQPPSWCKSVQPPRSCETRFEKVTWYWSLMYRFLLNCGVPIFRLEDLNREYGTLCDLSVYLEIEPPDENAWQNRSGNPVNCGSVRVDWTDYREEHFQQIAGSIQERFYA